MEPDAVHSPFEYLKSRLGPLSADAELRAYEHWWVEEGAAISQAVDRAGTPWLRMYDQLGRRVDEILYPPAYRLMLQRGYQAGAVWRAFADRSLLPAYQIGYITSFFDPGLYCPYIVSLSTAVPISKYGSQAVRERFLPLLLRQDGQGWQGATWMTEAAGGSDLGAAVETTAREDGDHWVLDGEKYFASNAGADLAVVAARPAGGPKTVRGLALFLVPRLRQDGGLNYYLRRLKDKIGTRSVPTGEVELRQSEAYLLGRVEEGIYLILEVLNLSRVGNSVGSAALTQRALSLVQDFARQRVAFGKPIGEHPLLRRQIEEKGLLLRQSFSLAWEAVRLLDQVWEERPRYSEHYHLFRLVAHLAKYYTAEVAVQTAKWAMEVYGGVGVLSEHFVERLLREAMILPIWEGTPHRQILDGMEVIERKAADRALFDYLIEKGVECRHLDETSDLIETWRGWDADRREAESEVVFAKLARTTASALAAQGV
ncbi:MAG: acyl-CoA dehydrogenase family protein [Anaerolineales bacterium]|jgi:alkylation response protein AidB-like acyl-CoA dehydrogenase